MKIFLCILCGYLLGSLSPSALLSRIKRKNLRKNGTGNLGATNVMLNFGKAYGVFVMVFDILKAYVTVKITAAVFPENNLLPLISGTAVVVGHIFPFYMKFKGGKGLASFGGLILAYDPLAFLVLLVIGMSLMLIFNSATFMPVSASILFPAAEYMRTSEIYVLIAAIVLSIVIIYAHLGNIAEVFKGTSPKIREYLKHGSSSDIK